MHYVYPRYVNEGDAVYVPWSKGMPDGKEGQALRCTVTMAAGYHARVYNEKYRVDRVMPLEALLVPPDAPNSSGPCGCNTCFREAQQKMIDNMK